MLCFAAPGEWNGNKIHQIVAHLNRNLDEVTNLSRGNVKDVHIEATNMKNVSLLST